MQKKILLKIIVCELVKLNMWVKSARSIVLSSTSVYKSS